MIFYIAYSNFEFAASSGIRKKIVGQTKTFKKVFGGAYFTMRVRQVAYLMDRDTVIDKETAITRQDYLRILVQWIEKYKVKRTYIRYPFADIWFIELLKYQKEHNIKTILEIPTYPYDQEMTCGRLKTEDAYYKEMVAQYVDVISTYSRDKTIWGKSCIPLTNGIDVENYQLCPAQDHKNRLVMIGISSGMAQWNGFERLIEGMKIYNEHHGAYDVRLKLVGKGAAENQYRNLVSKYGLQQQVDFYGFLSGGELNQAYEDVDLGVDTLGSYKHGIQYGCSLKGAEYCVRGLPKLCGYVDTRFPENTPFIFQVTNDDTPIDMEAVIAFYEKLSSQEGYREKIREYAVQHLTWDSIMRPVIDYLQ